jgi:hypothetical protein
MKTKNPSHLKSPSSRKAKRRAEAEERQAVWDNMSPDERVQKKINEGHMAEADYLADKYNR